MQAANKFLIVLQREGERPLCLAFSSLESAKEILDGLKAFIDPKTDIAICEETSEELGDLN